MNWHKDTWFKQVQTSVHGCGGNISKSFMKGNILSSRIYALVGTQAHPKLHIYDPLTNCFFFFPITSLVKKELSVSKLSVLN